jgi:uncharacterized protein (TIGR02145 family)
MKKSVVFSLTLFGILFLFGCAKEEDWIPDPIEYKGQMLPFQLSKLYVPNFKSKATVFEGDFGGRPLTLGKYSADSLIFIVPNLAVGNQQLKVLIDGKEWIWQIDITTYSNTVPVSSDFVELFIGQNELLHTEIKGIGNGLSAWADDYEKWLNRFKQDYSKLSVQEKEVIKGVFSNANIKYWFEIFNTDKMIPDCPENPMVTYLLQSSKFDQFNFNFFQAFAPLPDTQLYRTVLTGFGLALWHQHGWLEGLAANTLTCPLLREISLKKDINGSMNPEEETSLSFETGESAGFWIFGKYQLPNLQDMANHDDFVGDFVRRYDTFEAFREKSNNILSLYQEAFDFSLPSMAVDPLFDIPATANVEEKLFTDDDLTIYATVLENPLVRLSEFEELDSKVFLLFESLNGLEQTFDLHFFFGDKVRTGSRIYPALVKDSCPILLNALFEGERMTLEILFGTPPYAVTWDNGMIGTEFINLPSGEYNAVVVDAEGCERTITVAVPEYGTLTDIDGNVYKTVKIGSQWWMAENLRTTKKRDGIFIPEAVSNQAWQSASGPAFAWYDNLDENDIPLGKLYNVNAACCEVCPEGWHLPTFGEWNQLGNFLGSSAGGKMKTINGWNLPNPGATNESGFSAYPAGVRLPNGNFAGVGENTTFWTSSSDINGYPFVIFLYYQNERMSNTFAFNAREGYSIRCVKD